MRCPIVQQFFSHLHVMYCSVMETRQTGLQFLLYSNFTGQSTYRISHYTQLGTRNSNLPGPASLQLHACRQEVSLSHHTSLLQACPQPTAVLSSLRVGSFPHPSYEVAHVHLYQAVSVRWYSAGPRHQHLEDWLMNPGTCTRCESLFPTSHYNVSQNQWQRCIKIESYFNLFHFIYF